MPRRFLSVALALLCFAVSRAPAGDDIAALLRDLKAVGPQGAGSPAARAAWDRLVARGPAVLPDLLKALDTPDPVSANWLRTAFDHVVDAELAKGGRGLDADGLLRFVKDPKHQGRARRLALGVVERLRPGTTGRLVAGWLDDPEFRYEAVAGVLKEADAHVKSGRKEQAVAAYRTAFAAARDLGQAAAAAGRLREQGVTVSVLDHMGFLRDWYILGPFDAHDMMGFRTVYPPEEKIDLDAEYAGKGGRKVRWQRYHVAEPAPAAAAEFRTALVNFDRALGTTYDAVAYAYAAFRVPRDSVAEFRGAADDNFTVWVNGRRAFGFEEYRNGVRLDRHRFKVPLRAGVNTVLVKVCQAPVDPTNPEPNWEFVLRAVDATGKGIEMTSALPTEKK
jgi:hypothetical protein